MGRQIVIALLALAALWVCGLLIAAELMHSVPRGGDRAFWIRNGSLFWPIPLALLVAVFWSVRPRRRDARFDTETKAILLVFFGLVVLVGLAVTFISLGAGSTAP